MLWWHGDSALNSQSFQNPALLTLLAYHHKYLLQPLLNKSRVPQCFAVLKVVSIYFAFHGSGTTNVSRCVR